MSQIEELCGNPVPGSSTEQIQNVIVFLQRSNNLSKHIDSLMQLVSLMNTKDLNQLLLTPVLPDEMCENNLRYFVFFNCLSLSY